jgi:hypothetical protein
MKFTGKAHLKMIREDYLELQIGIKIILPDLEFPGSTRCSPLKWMWNILRGFETFHAYLHVFGGAGQN